MLAIVEGFGRICGRQANQHADHGLTWAHVLHPWPPLPSAPASSWRTCRAPAALPALSTAQGIARPLAGNTRMSMSNVRVRMARPKWMVFVISVNFDG